MKKLIFFILFSLHGYFLNAQPSIQWQKALGGTNSDFAQSIQQTYDGGYIIVGFSNSNDSDVTNNHGYNDFWVVKMNNTGVLQWEKSLGGSGQDEAYSIQQTRDSGYIITGFTGSGDGDVTVNNGYYDYWVVKLNSIGSIQWEKSLGGSGYDQANSINQTIDDGFIVAGFVESNDSDVTGNHGSRDYWVVKLSSTGTVQWEKSLGGSGQDEAKSIQETSDSGYIVVGISNSTDGNVTGNHGYFDYWVVKLNHAGIIQWQKSLGGTSSDDARQVRQTFDGGYIIAGSSASIDGDVTGIHGNTDYWVVKLNSIGIIEWEKTLGGYLEDGAWSIKQTTDSGYVVFGQSKSTNGNVTGNHGAFDYWVVKLNGSGIIQWEKSLGGTMYDLGHSIDQTSDDGYILAGYTYSNDGDVTGNNGFTTEDYWVVKLSPVITDVPEIKIAGSIFQVTPNPFSIETNLSFNIPFPNLISIEIHDLEGRLIKNLNSKKINIVLNEITWDGTNNSGGRVDEGIYIISVFTNYMFETKKVIVLRN